MEKILISSDEFKQLLNKIDNLNSKIDSLSKQNPLTDNWLDIQDVCQLLKVSKRTLQSYRDKGVLPFSQHGSKIYYKASDIQQYLEDNYKPAFANNKNQSYVR